jgi:3-oxoacyl-[acyl-carrier-protein] synthase-3
MKWDNIYVSGTGSFLPTKTSISDLQVRDNITDPALAQSGYVSCAEAIDISAREMAAQAVNEALERSGHTSDDISIIVYAIPEDTEHYAPACYLQRILKAPRALTFELCATSNSGMIGLEVAANLMSGNPAAEVAVVASTARALPPRWNRWLIGMVIGDGAAATILSRKNGIARLIAGAHSSLPDLEIMAVIRPSEIEVMRFPLLDVGLSPYYSAIGNEFSRLVEELLEESDVKLSEIARFAITGVGLAGTSAMILDPIGIPIEKTTWSYLREVGHGPCDPLQGLNFLVREKSLSRGDKVLLLGFGMGFRLACILIEMS